MALPPTRLTTLFSRIGPDPHALAQALTRGALVRSSTSRDSLESTIRETLAVAQQRPPHPGPTWADLVSTELQRGRHLNATGMHWATTNLPGSRLPRWGIMLVCGWWAFAGMLGGGIMTASPDHSGLIPQWLGPLFLLFGAVSAAATLGAKRRAQWAPATLWALAAAGILLCAGMAYAVQRAISPGKSLISMLLAVVLMTAICLAAARQLQREALYHD